MLFIVEISFAIITTNINFGPLQIEHVDFLDPFARVFVVPASFRFSRSHLVAEFLSSKIAWY